jgi:hypothetical protein
MLNFSYIVSDINNNTLVGNISVDVKTVNDKPIARDDIILISEDKGVKIPSLMKNDRDIDEGDNIRITKVSLAKHGVTDIVDGQVRYIPNKNFNGTDTFRYWITDDNGDSDVASVKVIVKEVNDAPRALDDDYSMNEDGRLIIADFMKNDVDADGDILFVKTNTSPVYGKLTYNGKNFLYIPEKDFNGVDYFKYVISDTKGNLSEAKISVNVLKVNDAPIAVDDGVFITSANTPLYIESVLGNDKDVDGNTLVIAKYTRPVNGEVSFDNKGSFIYIPNPGYVGLDRFTYTVSDGDRNSEVASIELEIQDKSVKEENDLRIQNLTSSGFTEEDPEKIINRINNF